MYTLEEGPGGHHSTETRQTEEPPQAWESKAALLSFQMTDQLKLLCNLSYKGQGEEAFEQKHQRVTFKVGAG